MTAKVKNETTVALHKACKENRSGSIYAHFTHLRDRPEGVAEVSFEPHGRSYRTAIQMPAVIREGYTDARETPKSIDGYARYTERYRPETGYEHFLEEAFVTAVLSCPVEAQLLLDVRLDGLNSPLLVDASLHGDVVYLLAKWQKGEQHVYRKFMVSAQVSLHNSARFGYNR